MTTLDWIIIAFTILMAVWGYGQGLIAGGLSLVGFAAGAFIGSRLGPLLLEDGSHSPYAPLSALLGAVLIGGVLASGFELLGFHLRRRMGERIGLLDGVGGALLVACLGLFLVWIGGAVALQTPGARDLREPIQRSAILKELNAVLPPSGPIIQALARFDPFPSITGPSANVPAPDPKIARDPDVAAARRSVVRVLGTACGLGVQGSGWVAGGESWSRTLTWWPVRTTRPCRLVARAPAWTRRRSGTTRGTTSRSCVCPGSPGCARWR